MKNISVLTFMALMATIAFLGCQQGENVSPRLLVSSQEVFETSSLSSDLWIEAGVGSRTGNDCDPNSTRKCRPCAGLCFRIHKGKKPQSQFTQTDYDNGLRMVTGELLNPTTYRMYFNLGQEFEDSNLMVLLEEDLPFLPTLAAEFSYSSITITAGNYQAYTLSSTHPQGFDAYVDFPATTTL